MRSLEGPKLGAKLAGGPGLSGSFYDQPTH